MARSVDALVNADILRWARNSAGFDLEDAARKLGVSSDKLAAWEEGSARPTIKQLFRLSNVYKRPATAFYLPEVPRKPTLQYQGDYRRLPGVANDEPSPNLIFALRRAEYRRRAAIDLHKDLALDIPDIPFLLSLDDDVEEGAREIRRFLDVPDEVQIEQWRKPNDAFNGWRAAIESVGVLVFQAQAIDILEMRAISIRERPLPFVLLNSADAINGRVFSLLHEFIHIVLRAEQRTDSTRPAEAQQLEIFCNAVASAVLMPKHLVVGIVEDRVEKSIDAEFVAGAAEALNVSREALSRRLVTLGYSDEAFYRAMRMRYLEEYREERARKRSEDKDVRIPYAVKIVNTVGYHFSQLVLDGLVSDRITAKDAADFFGASAKHLPNIETLVERRKATIRMLE